MSVDLLCRMFYFLEHFIFALSYQGSGYYAFGATISGKEGHVVYTVKKTGQQKIKRHNATNPLPDESLFEIQHAAGENCSFLETEGRLSYTLCPREKVSIKKLKSQLKRRDKLTSINRF